MSDTDKYRKLVEELKKLQTYGMVEDHYWGGKMMYPQHDGDFISRDDLMKLLEKQDG